jgi:hypothetical protein
MLGVRETDGPSGAPAVQAVAPQSVMEIPAAGRPKLPDRLRMDFKREDLVPIRITCGNKWWDQRQVIQQTGFIVALAGNPEASYTDRKANPRILCGSI